MCDYTGGEFRDNIETCGIGLFKRDEIPESVAVEKTTKEQILMCFNALDNPQTSTLFD